MEKLFINTTSMKAKATEENRTIEFVASKEIVDRVGDVVKIKGIDLKPFKKNPVVMWGHLHKDLPVGKATKIRKSGDELLINVQFPTPEEYGFADTIYKLIKGGYLNATSITIIPDHKTCEYPEARGSKDASRIINKSEFIELSIVPIPMNPAALATGKSISKAIDDGIVDDVEMKEYDIMCKELTGVGGHTGPVGPGPGTKDKEIPTEGFGDDGEHGTTEIVDLKSRVAELELQIKEQDMEVEEDSVYKALFEEFDAKKVLEEKGDDDILEKYFKDEEDDVDVLQKYFT